MLFGVYVAGMFMLFDVCDRDVHVVWYVTGIFMLFDVCDRVVHVWCVCGRDVHVV